MTRVTQLIHDAGKYLLISVYPLPTHPTHNFTHKNGGNLETLPGWPKKLDHNRPARCAGQLRGAQVNKNWIQKVLVGLSSSFSINYTCYHYTAVGKYCTLCVQTVEWCQLAWGTMETRFVYFFIVKWTLHSACFTSTAVIQIYILGARLMSFKKIRHISMSYLE